MRFRIVSVIVMVCVFGMGAIYGAVGDMVPADQLTATSSTSHAVSPDPMVVVDGSGISGDAHANSWGSWFTDTTDPDRWIVVDLGGTYHIGEMKVWNANEAWGWDIVGFNEMSVYISESSEPGNPVNNPDEWTYV